MPKGKRKGKTGASQKPRMEVIGLTSDEDSLNDNVSIISGFSETKSVIEEGVQNISERMNEFWGREKSNDFVAVFSTVWF
uniref:Uncharacterized protein n=1 Tax=Timema poppense TaxID=170557 RepID=A0A7R9DTJ4_TIMPO|nr:unnamed protein product [Timema poppensis]